MENGEIYGRRVQNFRVTETYLDKLASQRVALAVPCFEYKANCAEVTELLRLVRHAPMEFKSSKNEKHLIKAPSSHYLKL